MKFDWKKLLAYVVAIIAFMTVALVYCLPTLQGKVLRQHDIIQWKGAAQEAREYYDEHGTRTWWTNSMFGGMPTYQITGSLPSGEVRNGMASITRFGMKDAMEPIGLIFIYFFGFFLMLRCFKVNPWLSIVGGFAIGLSTYFLLIIPAGHITKAMALAYLAPIIGGFYAVFRKQYWLGAPLIILYGILGVTLHAQMTYYIFMLIGVMACAELYIHIREKRWKDLGISLSVLMISLLLVFGTKYSWWEMNQNYLKETMRGGHSELTSQDEKQTNNEGLDLQYATNYSYGIGETMTLLIPDWEGRASNHTVSEDSELCKILQKKVGLSKKDAKQWCAQIPTYHGGDEGTSGAIYVGAIVCFLFVLGLLIVPGPYKWALLAATIFSITLAWGRNMMWFTELFFNYFPMYNKFRTVESILVVAEITIPLLGFLALQRIVDKAIEWKKLAIYILVAGGLTAGICLFFGLFGGMIDVTSAYDTQFMTQLPAWLQEAILYERTAMIKADAWRSFAFILASCVLIFLYAWLTHKKEKTSVMLPICLYSCLAILVLADMIPVNKRFFNNNHYVSKQTADKDFAIRPYEQQILQDKSLDYRVLNLTTSTFNDARTSYRLKSIGGYSAAKLRRYQDLIDEHIIAEMPQLHNAIYRTQGFMIPDVNEGKEFPVLNMLNTKYVIMPTQSGELPVQNPYAMGNCWFVDEVVMVDTPDEESAALRTLNLHKQAVADKKFAEVLDITKPEVTPLMAFDETTINLTSYSPNRLEYSAMTEQNKVAVFSEIYYPYDWHLYLVDKDGNNSIEIPLARVNYTLRAAVIPAGTHQLRMVFEPHALKTDKASMAFLILALVLSAGALTSPLWRKKK
jgi:hypothetical protein